MLLIWIILQTYFLVHKIFFSVYGFIFTSSVNNPFLFLRRNISFIFLSFNFIIFSRIVIRIFTLELFASIKGYRKIFQLCGPPNTTVPVSIASKNFEGGKSSWLFRRKPTFHLELNCASISLLVVILIVPFFHLSFVEG